MLVDLTVKDFLKKTASNEPAPGGGSIAALNAAIAASLTEMVANLTIGRKKYEDKEAQMQQIALSASEYQEKFIKDIDADSDAYNNVFAAFKLPKETEEEKAARSAQIQAATKIAAEVPLDVARYAYAMMDIIAEVARNGNQNAITDACVAIMTARTAVLSAILNVKINLLSIKDSDYIAKTTAEIDELGKNAIAKELELIGFVKNSIG